MDLQPTDFLSGLGGLQNLPNPYRETQQVTQDQQQQQGNAQALQLGALKLAAIGQQHEQAQQYAADVKAALDHPSSQNFAALMAKYPEQHEALKQAWDAQDAPTKQANLQQLGNVFSFLSNNKPDLAAKSLQARIDAERAQGMDTSDDEQILGLLTSGNPDDVKAAKGIAGYHLASALGPEKYGQTLKDLGLSDESGDEFSNTPQGDIYSRRTGEVTHEAGPKPEVDTIKVFDENGNLVGSRRVTHPVAGGVSGEQIEQLALSAVPGATVTSRARTPEHNAEVGGVPNSYHLTDQARDMVPPPGMSIGEFHNRLQVSLPGVKVLNEGDHVHIQPIARNTPAASSGFQTKPLGPMGASSLLDDATITMMAQQYLAGDPSVMQNLGRGKQGAENIVRLRSQITKQAKAAGMSGSDIAAQMADFKGTLSAERAAGTRTANVELASTEAQRLFPLALQASQALPRTGFLPFSRAQQAIRSGTNDPKLRQFVAANMALVNVYSRAVSPTGQPTDSDKAHARQLLDTAYDQPSYAATLQQMQKEIQAARAAPKDVRSDLRAQVSGRTAGAPSVPADVAAILKKYGH